jgi:hypothetical protein
VLRDATPSLVKPLENGDSDVVLTAISLLERLVEYGEWQP